LFALDELSHVGTKESLSAKKLVRKKKEFKKRREKIRLFSKVIDKYESDNM